MRAPPIRFLCLDGIRGWAALFVVIGHLGPVFLLSNYNLKVIPFFMDGQLSVFVFFVLSGFVLSVRFFETGNPQVLYSLLVRRYPRLVIPILISCVLAASMSIAGLMQNKYAGKLANSPWLESFYSFDTSIFDAIKFGAIMVFIDPMANSYNAVLWTMVYEMWGSIVVLLFLIISSFLGKYFIFVGCLTLGGIAIYHNSPMIAFVLGVILAYAYTNLKSLIGSFFGGLENVAMCVMFISLLLGMLRVHYVGYSPLFLSLIAFFIIGSVLFSQLLKEFFANRLGVFLGKISFPLYLTHLLIICSWSSWIFIELNLLGLSGCLIFLSVVISTLVLSLGVAYFFLPIETVGIKAGRVLSMRFIGK